MSLSPVYTPLDPIDIENRQHRVTFPHAGLKERVDVKISLVKVHATVSRRLHELLVPRWQ